jgi:pilus assembly protein Flp/PilA
LKSQRSCRIALRAKLLFPAGAPYQKKKERSLIQNKALPDTVTAIQQLVKRDVIMTKRLLGFLHQEDGVTSIEYAIMSSLIAVAIVAAVSTLGVELQGNYEYVRDQVVAATS